MENSPELSRTEPESEERRSDWIGNHVAMETAFFELVKMNKRMPTQKEISEHSGIPYSTVKRHFDEFDLGEIVQQARTATGRVLLGLINGASRGNPAAVKLFFQIIHKWREGMEVSIPRAEHLFMGGKTIEQMTDVELDQIIKASIIKDYSGEKLLALAGLVQQVEAAAANGTLHTMWPETGNDT
jgi:hypothetical protein